MNNCKNCGVHSSLLWKYKDGGYCLTCQMVKENAESKNVACDECGILKEEFFMHRFRDGKKYCGPCYSDKRERKNNQALNSGSDYKKCMLCGQRPISVSNGDYKDHCSLCADMLYRIKFSEENKNCKKCGKEQEIRGSFTFCKHCWEKEQRRGIPTPKCNKCNKNKSIEGFCDCTATILKGDRVQKPNYNILETPKHEYTNPWKKSPEKSKPKPSGPICLEKSECLKCKKDGWLNLDYSCFECSATDLKSLIKRCGEEKKEVKINSLRNDWNNKKDNREQMIKYLRDKDPIACQRFEEVSQELENELNKYSKNQQQGNRETSKEDNDKIIGSYFWIPIVAFVVLVLLIMSMMPKKNRVIIIK